MAIQQTTQIPEVKDTIVMLRQLSADEQVRMEAHYREKRLHDEATALGSARREGRAEGMIETLVALVNDGVLTVTDAATRANMTVSEFEAKTGIKA